MNDVTRPPPPQDPNDVDDRYRRASAADPSRPSSAVRQAVLAHAAKVAAERKSGSKAFFSWLRGLTQGWSGPALIGTLAAAAIAGMVILPRVQMFHRARVEMEAPKRAEDPRVEITVTAHRIERQNLNSASPITTVEEDTKSLASASPPSQPGEPGKPGEAQAAPEQRLPEVVPAPSLDVAPAPAPLLPASPPQPSPSPSPADTAPKDQPAVAERFEARESASAAKEITGGFPQGSTAARSEAAPKAAQATAPAAAPSPAQPSASSSAAGQTTTTPAANSRRDGSLELQEITVTGSEIRGRGLPPEQLRLNYQFRRAAEKGDVAKLESFLTQGAYLDMPDSSGRTALLLAVQNRHADIVNALLEKNADPNIPDNKGVTPLKAALYTGQKDLAELLRNHGAH